MKNILILNLSPRQKGTSAMLAARASDVLQQQGHRVTLLHLYPHLNRLDTLLEAVGASDVLLFIGPCYINTYPADTTALLQALAARPDLLHGQQVYGIIQGGMPYIHTHAGGLDLLRLFCARCVLRYQGGFVMGMGAMLDGQTLDKLPHGKSVIRQFDTFLACIHRGEAAPMALSEQARFKAPRLAFRLLALVANRRIDANLRKQGIDAKQPSPYLEG